jgi:hypothetical protein
LCPHIKISIGLKVVVGGGVSPVGIRAKIKSLDEEKL